MNEGRAIWKMVAVTIFLLPATASAQSVRVAPDRTTIALGQTLRVEVVLSGRFDSVNGPDLPDFDVVGKSSGTSISILNGQMQQEQRVSLTLAPKRAGNLAIGAVELVAGGKVVASSKPVPIRVVGQGGALPPDPGAGAPTAPPQAPPAEEPAPSGPAEPGAVVPERYANRQAFVLARAPSRPLYVGEPLYVEYLLYTRGDVPLSGIRLEAIPKLKGFVVEAGREGSDQATRVRVGAQPFDVRVLWRAAVTAIEPGRAVLDPLTAGVYVGDFFGRRRYALASDPVALEFLPIPTEGRPADFVEGTLGSFVLKASVKPPTVRVGESAVLTLEVTGTGNLRGVKAPTLQPPDGVRVARVPSADLDELVVDVGGISGRRAFQYLLTPEREGDFDLGRIALPCFNPISGRFERARTDPVRVSAQGGRGGGRTLEVQRGDPVVPILEQADLSPVTPVADGGAPRGVLWAGLGLPVAFWLGAEAAARRRAWLEANGARVRGRGAWKRARAALDRLSGPGLERPDFWVAVDGVVREFLAERFGVPATTRTASELAADLADLGAPPEVVTSLAAELEACAFGRFAPSAALDRDRAATLARLRETLTALDRVRDREVGRA